MKTLDCQCKICGRLRSLNNLGQCGMCEAEQKCKSIEPEFIDMLQEDIAAKDKEIADLKESLTWALDAAEKAGE